MDQTDDRTSGTQPPVVTRGGQGRCRAADTEGDAVKKAEII
jgi:hypothetical protein